MLEKLKRKRRAEREKGRGRGRGSGSGRKRAALERDSEQKRVNRFKLVVYTIDI